jgi:hypothetical protein
MLNLKEDLTYSAAPRTSTIFSLRKTSMDASMIGAGRRVLSATSESLNSPM